jgi:hypothetical protein
MSYTVLMIRVPTKGHPVPAYELKKTFEGRETAVAAAAWEVILAVWVVAAIGGGAIMFYHSRTDLYD